MMTYEEAQAYGDRLAQMFLWVKQEVELGRSEEEVVAELHALDLLACEEANAAARAAGRTDEEIQAFWDELQDFGDADPLEDLDATDEGYNDRLAAVAEHDNTQPLPEGVDTPEEVV
jgi:hypothetical protein